MDDYFHGRSPDVYGYGSRNCDTAADHYATTYGDATSYSHPATDIHSVANRNAAADRHFASSVAVCCS